MTFFSGVLFSVKFWGGRKEKKFFKFLTTSFSLPTRKIPYQSVSGPREVNCMI